MNKNNGLEIGQMYGVPLSDGSYTVAHLVNHHVINTRLSQDSFAFFNYKFPSIGEVKSSVDELDISKPFAIATSNSKPKVYGWVLLGKRHIVIDVQYKNDISSLGLYKNCSADPSIFLEPYFGLFPWDGYFKDDYLDKYLLPNITPRDDIKYMKDFTTDSLKELLPPSSPKLIERLNEN